jgi:MiaB-like protein
MKVVVETLGCKVNAYESELIKEMFLNNKDEIIDDKTLADVIVINTCTVTNQADSKGRKLIRQARRDNENAILIVCGCMTQNHEDIDIDADIILGNKDKSKILDLIDEFKKNRKQIRLFYDLRNVSFEDMKITHFEHKTRGFVKIQDGCNNFCSYCIIPFVRGNIRSKNIDVAYDEIKCLVDNGYQEIVLTGIHTGSYGVGENFDLVDLIRKISTLDGLKRIRISSIEITELNDKFMEEFKNNLKICSHLHVPIQSGSDHVLKNMNRKYDITYFKEKTNLIKSLREDVNLTTDLIVGFPEETDEDFNTTKQNLIDIGFSKIHTFPYSIRRGTKASMMKQVNDTVKKNRTHEILELSDRLENAYYQKYIGKIVTVLVEDNYSGFTSNYIKVHFDEFQENNTFVDCLITEVDGINVKGIVK